MENNPYLLEEHQYAGITVFSLSRLNAAIRETLEHAFPEILWVVAEISEIRCNSRGHCYLELVEREDEETVAQIRANIWSRTFRSLAARFEKETGESLKQGMKVLLQASVNFHELYGLSLNVRDIDPAYSLGEMARKKREVIEQLRKERLTNLNREVPLPLVIQRIAVISSATAAGYGDLVNHLDENPYGYKIFHTLYQASMQGQEATASIISALREVNRRRNRYDAVVIVRGGGSQIDLSCFDTYALAVEVAKSSLPVITGIGHERDDTVTDIVAHTKLKTPTAVAEFLLSNMISFEERLVQAQAALIHLIKELLQDEDRRLSYIAQNFKHIAKDRFNREFKRIEIGLHKLIHETTRTLDSRGNTLKLSIGRIAGGLIALYRQQENRIKHCDQAIRLLDPVNVMKRGYSITYLNEKAVRDSAELREGDIITTKIYKGSVKSRVEALDGEKQIDLFIGDRRT
jgi:exodeoxyribonuclease VII large subunit